MERWRAVGFLGAVGLWTLVGLGAAGAEGAKWSRAYINALPDEAFASVEERPDGTRARHLPHHGADGRVDLPHLRNALSRLDQVQWVNPANVDEARRHLLGHLKALGLPVPGEGRARPPRFLPRPRLFRPHAPIVATGHPADSHTHSLLPPAPRTRRAPRAPR